MKHFAQAVQDLSKNNSEPRWLEDLRLDALASFERTPAPAKNEEEWRKVDLNQVFFSDLDVESGQTPAKVQSKIFFYGTLSQAAREIPDTARPYFERSRARNSRKFDALNNALWNGGIFLHVPKNTAVPSPVFVVLEPAPKDSHDRPSFFPKKIIVLEEGSSITLVSDERTAPDWAGWLGSMTEIYLKPGARLSLVRVQDASQKSTVLSSLYSIIERDASLNLLVVSTGSALNKSNWSVDLLQEGAAAQVFGLVKGGGNQNFDHSILVTHQAARTESNVLFKTALREKSRSLFTGLIHVRKAAQRTNAYQTNRNLILSKDARADTIPKLEIEADDVKCGHGAAVSSIDPDQVYYLMSRGLSKEEAESMIIEGFYEEVLGKFVENGGIQEPEGILDLLHGVLFGSSSVLPVRSL